MDIVSLFVILLTVACAALGLYGLRVNPKGYFAGAISGTLFALIAWSVIAAATVWFVSSTVEARPQADVDLRQQESLWENLDPVWGLVERAALVLAVLGWLVGGLGGALFWRIGGSRLLFDPADDEESSAGKPSQPGHKKNKKKKRKKKKAS